MKFFKNPDYQAFFKKPPGQLFLRKKEDMSGEKRTYGQPIYINMIFEQEQSFLITADIFCCMYNNNITFV